MAGRARGKQSVEDRVILLRATSEEAAKREALKLCRADETPYANSEGTSVRWHCEGIVDVQELLDDRIDPRGTEVFSLHKERKIRPQDIWTPPPTKGKPRAKPRFRAAGEGRA